MPEPISESDRRLNVEFRVRNALTKHGGQRIIHGHEMEQLVAELRVVFDELAIDGRFLPTIAEARTDA